MSKKNSSHNALLFTTFLLLTLSMTAQTLPRWTMDNLLEDRFNIAVAVTGQKIFYFSGTKRSGNSSQLSSTMEIHHPGTGNKQLLNIPEGAEHASSSGSFVPTAIVGSKIYFIGGHLMGGPRMDVYDTLTGEWGYIPLAEPKGWHAAAVWNNKIYIGGGSYDGSSYKTMNIYNTEDNSWETLEWTHWGGGGIAGSSGKQLTGVALAGTILFAGGALNGGTPVARVRYYKTSTGTFLEDEQQSSILLSEARDRLGSFVYQGKAWFVGGRTGNLTPSYAIDIYDPATHSWEVKTIPTLSEMGVSGSTIYDYGIAQAGSKMFLLHSPHHGTTDSVTIYDIARDTWKVEEVPGKRSYSTIFSFKNNIYFAGGRQLEEPKDPFIHSPQDTNIIAIYHLYPKLEALTMTGDTLQSINEVFALSEDSEETISLRLHNTGDYKAFFAQNEVQLTINNKVTLTPITLPDSLNPAEEVILTFNIDISEEAIIKDTIIVNTNITGLEELKIPLEFTIEEKDPNAMPDITALEKQFTLYPNPARDIVHVKIPQNTTRGSQIRLLNISGTIITEKTVQNNVETLSLSTMAPGLYFVQLEIEGYLMTRKLVVE